MTSNDTRATTLARALRAGIERDRATLEELLTDDVRAWTPAWSATSRTELIETLDGRDEAFSALDVAVVPLDVGGNYACAEWTVEMTHTGPLTLADDRSLEPTGIRVTLHGVTVAEFADDRICAVRQYWDEFAVYEQLGVLSAGE